MSKAGATFTQKPNTAQEKPSQLNSTPSEISDDNARTIGLGQVDSTSPLRCYNGQLSPEWVDAENGKADSKTCCLMFTNSVYQLGERLSRCNSSHLFSE
jgi:hypothetical protein